MAKLVLLIIILTASLTVTSAQELRQDTVQLNSKTTPQDTLAPFDKSSNKHIEVPNPNRPATNATPVPPRKEDLAPRKKVN